MRVMQRKSKRSERCRARLSGGKDGSCWMIHSCGRPKGHSGPHGCWAHHPYLWDWLPDPNKPGVETLEQDFGEEIEAEVAASF